ncbi:MAG: polyribonucleotide nucleotidyltransferase [Candidatus Gracilibacteria bacterium]|nr:polyribonucleotide nucleotidyltransferase [Candidatus Gracilibacteria bacterium]
MEPIRVETEFAGRKLIIETGKLALQASGSVTVQYGDTVVFAAATMSSQVRGDMDFFPLTVDYEEKFYASGKINGSRFIKREGRPSDNAVLTSRLIDRAIRPLFPKNLRNDVQIICSVLSADGETDPAMVAMLAASAAMMVGGLPFEGPIAGMAIGLKDDKFIVSPTYLEEAEGILSLFVAGTSEHIMMVEAGANEVSEEKMIEAFALAQENMKPLVKLQEELIKKVKPEKLEDFELSELGNETINIGDDTFRIIKLKDEVDNYVTETMLDDVIFSNEKKDYAKNLEALYAATIDKFASVEEFPKASLRAAIDNLLKYRLRKHILENDKRPDGRNPKEIRPITCEVGLLPRTHGSAVFKRGETQALTIATLASKGAGQMVEDMDMSFTRYYMHHYNFPPYSAGETRPLRSPGRREIGHGYLAERALKPMIPDIMDFPYTIRVVTEIMASSGSTSQAAVCGSTLSLMDAGVPIKRPVSGIAMGLVIDQESGNYKVLSDIKDLEDFGGDMDFKVAGTSEGITALQMDIKVKGLSLEILKNALAQAKEGRAHILGEMLKVLDKPRSELSQNAPRAISMQVRPDQIREVIGSGGKVINGIIDETGVDIDIDDDGKIFIYAKDQESADKAQKIVQQITYQFTPGEIFEGNVVKIITSADGKEIGAIVERFPGKDGMVHISEFANRRIEKISEVCKIGDKLKVKVIDVDPVRGRVSLSHKATLDRESSVPARKPAPKKG